MRRATAHPRAEMGATFVARWLQPRASRRKIEAARRLRLQAEATRIPRLSAADQVLVGRISSVPARTSRTAAVPAGAPLQFSHEASERACGFNVELVVLVQNPQLLFILRQDLQYGVDGIFLVSHKT